MYKIISYSRLEKDIKMNIIIPMTGYGSRFVAAGYQELKPVIKVLGKPMIEWIIEGMYDSAKDHFIFICRNEHIRSGLLNEDYLKSLARHVTVRKIDNWIKLGPVYDILRAEESVADDVPCIVNYCDFYAPWNWNTVKQKLSDRDCDGAVIAFTGFQPCLVPEKNVYASCLCDRDGNLIEIREKYCFSMNRFEGLHSTGTYFFKNGALLKKYYQKTVEAKAMLNGEYYASLPYNFLVRDGLKVWVPVFGDKFYTWGTPQDLEEFVFWAETLKGWEDA